MIGSFPNSSIWPFVLGMGLFLMVAVLRVRPVALAPAVALVISAADRRDRREPARGTV